MSETRTEDASGLLDETGQKISKENLEPLLQYIRQNPVCTAFVALGIGFVLAKML